MKCAEDLLAASGETIVAMCVHRDKLYIATNANIYLVDEDGPVHQVEAKKLIALEFNTVIPESQLK